MAVPDEHFFSNVRFSGFDLSKTGFVVGGFECADGK
jgi:hypothetical protein